MIYAAKKVLASLVMLAMWTTLAAAQGAAGASTLTVRPREMATATRTEAAGEFELDSPPGYLIHVPPQCVGTQRCPLLVIIPGGGQSAAFAMMWQRTMADKHGIIVLAGSDGLITVASLDEALQHVLGKFAIDPDKIAVLGRCAGGDESWNWGGDNLNVFSRILPISGGGYRIANVDQPNRTTEFFLDGGLWESAGNFKAARELRKAGHPVKLVVALRAHGENVEDYDFVGKWLQESWATPDPAKRSAPRIIPGPTPELTLDILTRMTAFWTRFMEEPDSIFMTGRRAHQRETLVPVGEDQPSVMMMDMPALAAKYSSVAAALKAAELTPEQHDAYRVALLSVLLTGHVEQYVGPVEKTAVLAKNVAFMAEHPTEFEALANAGVERVELIGGLGMDGLSLSQDPEEMAKKYALGIWLTP